MIVPSIDLMDGQAVQLVGGARRELEAGDPRVWARRFAPLGEIAVVDLDRALRRGENDALVEELLSLARCRVGGGVRSVEAARAWLDRGAARVVLGTAAEPALLAKLPPERVIVALDARDGEVVVDGWRRGTGRRVAERMRELEGLAGAFLVTFVEREGRLAGLDEDAVLLLREAAGDAELTIAGGVRGASDVARLDGLGADAQVGMALYRGLLSLADAFLAPVKDPGGPWPTVVCDEHGEALGLVWSTRESIEAALESGRGVYHSRRRGLWVKGESSGATQELLGVALDCDRDALRFTVRQSGSGFCHLGSRSCFGQGRGLPELARRLATRRHDAPEGSYTRRLFEEEGLLEAKLVEEANELAAASAPSELLHEAADLVYFAMVTLVRGGLGLEALEAELDRRALSVSRRGGDRKPEEGR